MTSPQGLGSVEDFFAGSGGGEALKFEQVGQVHAGKIQHLRVSQQTKYGTQDLDFNKDGSPKLQIVATLATQLRDPANPEDDGTRLLYIKGNMQYAIAKALKKHNLTAPQVGGTLVVKHSGTQPSGKGNDLKLYEAAYQPAAPAGVEAAFAQGQPAQQQQVQQAPPQQTYRPPVQEQPAAQAPVQQAAAQPQQQAAPAAQGGFSAAEAALLSQLQ